MPRSISETMKVCEEELQFSILPVKNIHLEILRTLPWIHKDPFDRLIISQAISEDMTLVSADEHVIDYPACRGWKI